MVRKDTNKQYSLRKLKTGTASVAVAVAVLGAGFANQTEVKAAGSEENVPKQQYNALWEENEDLRGRERKYIAKLEKEEIQNGELNEKNRKLEADIADLQDVIEDNDQEIKRKDRMYEAFLKQSKDQVKDLTAEKDTLAEKAKKLEEDKQISDASRQGLSRDLEASREAKKKVEADLAEANSKLQALEKLNKELEEGKKLSEKEKAELQAKLDAQGKALKEQLAKQTEELAKLRAEKAAGSKTPATKPANKERSGRATQTATRPSQNKGMRSQLPSTGEETTNPFFTAAALTVIASAGVFALK
ncbi:IgA receptor, partial [Escherichia coli]